MNFRILKREPTAPDITRVLFVLPSEEEATAEDFAMLQALYSRDPRPIDDAARLAKTSKSGEFMEKFYVGYGHESIAELGMVVIAIENVPMPVAKLIQHYQLYKGQECSTRYLDYSRQPFMARTAIGAAFQDRLRAFYLKSKEPTVEHLMRENSLPESERKAARAASFDVLRGFLPVGAVTNLCWFVDLRNLNSQLDWLYPFVRLYPELGFVLEKIESLFAECFPHSFRERKKVDREPMLGEDPCINPRVNYVDMHVDYHGLRSIHGRQRATVEWGGLIDFASWRDLARHRSVEQTFPYLETRHGFELWYWSNLPAESKHEAMMLIQEAKVVGIVDPYAIPMGFKIPYFCSGPLSKFRYIAKLRSGPTVHPTLRSRVQDMALWLTNNTGLSIDYDQNREWMVGGKRGLQDILRRP